MDSAVATWDTYSINDKENKKTDLFDDKNRSLRWRYRCDEIVQRIRIKDTRNTDNICICKVVLLLRGPKFTIGNECHMSMKNEPKWQMMLCVIMNSRKKILHMYMFL